MSKLFEAVDVVFEEGPVTAGRYRERGDISHKFLEGYVDSIFKTLVPELPEGLSFKRNENIYCETGTYETGIGYDFVATDDPGYSQAMWNELKGDGIIVGWSEYDDPDYGQYSDNIFEISGEYLMLLYLTNEVEGSSDATDTTIINTSTPIEDLKKQIKDFIDCEETRAFINKAIEIYNYRKEQGITD